MKVEEGPRRIYKRHSWSFASLLTNWGGYTWPILAERQAHSPEVELHLGVDVWNKVADVVPGMIEVSIAGDLSGVHERAGRQGDLEM